MAASHGTLLVVGSGPGIGVNVAKLFAERGFRKVILTSRNAERLAKEVEQVKAAASGTGKEVEVVSTTIDLGDKKSVDAGLREVERLVDSERLEAVLFNAARVGPSKLWEFSTEEIENDLQVCLPRARSPFTPRGSYG